MGCFMLVFYIRMIVSNSERALRRLILCYPFGFFSSFLHFSLLLIAGKAVSMLALGL